MPELGKWLITIGLIITVMGFLFTISGNLPWLGKLPGDISIKRENFSFYFPLASCILVSVIVSLVLWLLRK